MTLVEQKAICSICGKPKAIAIDRRKVLKKQSLIDIYHECEDCVRIPLRGRKIKNKEYLV